jgi:hypothetical protein
MELMFYFFVIFFEFFSNYWTNYFLDKERLNFDFAYKEEGDLGDSKGYYESVLFLYNPS